MVLAHAGTMSWDCCVWSDDNLSTKKLYPKFQFPSKSKKWLPRVKTCDESTVFAVKRLQNTHEKLPMYMRKKPDIAHIEAVSERAAALHHLGQELQLSVPIKSEDLEREWYNPWSMGSEHVDVEVQVAVMDKSDSFSVVQNIPTFRRLIDAHLCQAPSGPIAADKAALDVDEFNLVMKQLKYDRNVFETWEKMPDCARSPRACYPTISCKPPGDLGESRQEVLARVHQVPVLARPENRSDHRGRLGLQARRDRAEAQHHPQ